MDLGDEGGEGEWTSFGDDGSPGHLVWEKVDGEPTVEDASSEIEELLECLLKDLVKVEDAVLKSDLTGEVVTEGV